MQVRLGFAVITTLEEPIVLVDEVLAVGDKRFREKCYERMESLVDDGRTLFLVSHSEQDLERFCKRGLYIEGGRGAGRRAGGRRPRPVQRGPAAQVTSSGPLVVLLGDGPLPDGLEQAVAARCHRGARPAARHPRARRARSLAAVVESAGADPVVLVDARALSVATVYGDVAADPRPDTAVLRTTAGQVVALRVRAEDVAVLGEPGLAGWAAPAQLLERASAALAARGPVREVTPGDFPLVLVDDDGLAGGAGRRRRRRRGRACGCAGPPAATTASSRRSWSGRCRGG